MNHIKVDNTVYKCESCWRSEKNKVVNDINNKPFPFPHEEKYWYNKTLFLSKLSELEKFCSDNKKIEKHNQENCLLCGKKNITNKMFTFNHIKWTNGLYHYIEQHNVHPSDEFKSLVFGYTNKKFGQINEIKRITSVIKKKMDMVYLQLIVNHMEKYLYLLLL